jgi:transposase InsO family protein
MTAVTELAVDVGTSAACQALRMPRASYYRNKHASLRTAMARRRSRPPRALAPAECETVLAHLHSERFQDRSPAAVYATLLDEGEHHCSIRTMYRLLEQRGESRERRDQLTHPPYRKPELLATAANQLWSWDITKLLGPVKWTYFYLYVILDVFSRYATGWMVAHRESAELAKRLIEESCKKQHIQPGQLTLHADRGTSMSSKPVAFLLADLGVTKTHSRPPRLRRQSVFGESVPHHEISAGVPGPLWVHPGQSCFLSDIFSLVQHRTPALWLGLIDAGHGSLWASGKHPAATPESARPRLPAPPGALRTKRSQTTGPSERGLDQPAGSSHMKKLTKLREYLSQSR